MLTYILITLFTFFMMELVTWATHKYAMHGFMWFFHEDHHQVKPGFFEKNDFFFLIFAIPSWLCIMLGLMHQYYFVVSIGVGIAMYGVAYFFVHDVFIHQRFKWFRNSDNVYLRALRKAHKVHHKHLNKEDGECFGMLWVPTKYYKEAKRAVDSK
ncbi:MAG: sterol desaturase family protein [Bacteroidetes bacterium]|nr:sterol desaturase family protein [Bacteroidota bacterium]